MNAERIHILTFGRFSPSPSARVRRWVQPGRGIAVSRKDILVVHVDRVNDHDQVVFRLFGEQRVRVRKRALCLPCPELNFDVIARALARDEHGRVDRVLIELINLHLAAVAP